MKKLLSIFIVICMLTTQFTTVMAFNLFPQERPIPPKMMDGIIIKIFDDRPAIEVKNSQNEKETVILNYSEKTYFADSDTGLPTEITSKNLNDRVIVYYGPAETRSLPPQSKALAVICNINPDNMSPRYAKVEEVTKEKEQIHVTTDGGSRIVTLNSKTQLSPFKTKNIPVLDEINVGTDLLLYYTALTLSDPGKATATKAIILGHESPAESTEIPPSETATSEPETTPIDEVIISEVLAKDIKYSQSKTGDTIVMLPLRALVESFGFVIAWNGESKEVTLTNGKETHVVKIGTNTIGDVELSVVPVIIEDKTYVSIEFFEKILGGVCTIETDKVTVSYKKPSYKIEND